MSDSGVIFIAAGTDHVRAANLAAQSVRELAPSLMVDLFTDVPDIADQTLFDQIHRIKDPHAHSKVDYYTRDPLRPNTLSGHGHPSGRRHLRDVRSA